MENLTAVIIIALIISFTQIGCGRCGQCSYTTYYGSCTKGSEGFYLNYINLKIFNDTLAKYRSLGYTCDSIREVFSPRDGWMCGKELKDFESADAEGKRICY